MDIRRPSIVGCFCKAPKIVPSDTTTPKEPAWCVVVTFFVTMPTQVFTCLTESLCVLVAYIWKAFDNREILEFLRYHNS